jgi:hypothetical protein
VLRRTPHFLTYQPACKPGSVGHRLACARRYVTAIPLGRCLHIASSNLPGRREPDIAPASCRFHEQPALPSLFGLAPGVVCHAGSVAGPAVRSYRTFSPLPHPKRRRFVLCGTVPGVAPAGCYPAPYVDGARTFLSSHLSAITGAAVRPTDAPVMGAREHRVKPIAPTPAVKINYPEDVVLRLPVRLVSAITPSKGATRCSIC